MANNNLLATRSMALIIKYIHITPEKHKYIYFLRNKKYAIKKKNQEIITKSCTEVCFTDNIKIAICKSNF